MAYKIPLKDGKVNWATMEDEVWQIMFNEEDGEDILKALYNYALEEAAKVAREDGCDDNECTAIVSDAILTLKEPI